jgi:SAM-dependent methyltransferase
MALSRTRRVMRGLTLVGVLAGAGALGWSGVALPADRPVQPPPPAAQETQRDVPYVPTPTEVVDEMLRVANVSKDDVVYDLGSGDGRIVIRAAEQHGARGVGIDIDPERVKEAETNAREAGVSDRVTFREQNLFDADIREATVVTLYLLPDINLKLRPKLWRELKPGTRVVSHAFDMGDWNPEQTIEVAGRTIYYWTIPNQRGQQ